MAAPQSSRKAAFGPMSFLPPYRSDSKEQFSPTKDQFHTDKARIADDKFEDPYGPRLGKAARFWRVYVQESDLSDEELSRGWNEMLDVILLFAALFSAICTAFVMESLQYLSPDDAGRTNDMLLIISRSLLANANHSISLPTEAMLQPAEFSPPTHAIVTNTLWFLSLMISLSVTLISILAKEWCHVYMAGRTGPMHEQARRRQQRFDGLNKWRMKGLIAFLPTFMHISLFLFVIGLSIHLWAIYNSIAKPVIVFTAVMILLYLTLTITPFISEFCPYTTAFSRLLTDLWLKGRDRIYHTNDIPSDNIPMDIVTSRALSWVISHCENEKSVDVALQAIAGANHSLPCEPLWKCNAAGLVSQRLHGCFLAEGLPVTNSGFESLVNLGHESPAFRLCVLYARVLNVLAWHGINDSSFHSMRVFRDIWSEYELFYENLSKYSDSETPSYTTVGYAGISIWRRHRPSTMSNLVKGTNSPLGVSSYILRVLERPRSLQNHQAQLFELFYALLRGIMDSNIRSIQNHTAYKQNLISNLVSILKFIPCDSLLSDFSFVSQVFAASGLILNGYQLDPELIFKTIGRYAHLDEHQPGLLLFIGLLGLIQASESIDAGHTEDVLPTPELEIVFVRLIQLKVFLVSNTEGSWPSPSLRLPFEIGNVEYTYNEYALDIISTYYIRHINVDSISQHRCAGLAAGLIVANVMADDCILDYWRPIVDDALSKTGSPKALRWVYPNTRSHAAVRVKAPFLDVALFAVLTLLKHEPKTETQAIRLVQCFHEMADQLQEVSRRVDEPIVNDLLERVIEEDMIDPFINALLSIRADRPYSKYWRGIDAEPKVAWWGARLIWLVRRSVRRRENEEDGGAVADIVERFCLGRDKVLESEKDEKPEVKLSIITEYQERDERGNSEDPKPLPERLGLFKFVLLSEMSNPGDTQSILEEIDETPKLKRSWTQLVHKTRRKLSGPSENTQYSALV